MAAFDQRRSSTSSPSPNRHRPRQWALRVERCCSASFIYFPLLFVYSVTTWALYVSTSIGFLPPPSRPPLVSPLTAVLSVVLYLLLIWSYTVAVFTSPGSPSPTNSHLPTHAPASSLTVKSTGSPRFCKKCHAPKPDRVHHCSTCRRCVLKMDHHCPWLATCVGLRNYKPFLLFLLYTTVYCLLSFSLSASWVYHEISSASEYSESIMPVNYIMLTIIAGIIGLVLAGFTGWHISLAIRNATTIECLEKTRYLSPLRHEMRRQRTSRHTSEPTLGERILTAHANMIPGATRDEEGIDGPSPTSSLQTPSPTTGPPLSLAQTSLQQNYASLERAREQSRHAAYLDEQLSASLPNAFDLGWRRNLIHVLGPTPLLWFLPICNTTGSGWSWDINPTWTQRRAELLRERATNGPHGEDHSAWNSTDHTATERHFLAMEGTNVSMDQLPRMGDHQVAERFDSASAHDADDDDEEDEEEGEVLGGDAQMKRLLKDDRPVRERQDTAAGDWKTGDDW